MASIGSAGPRSLARGATIKTNSVSRRPLLGQTRRPQSTLSMDWSRAPPTRTCRPHLLEPPLGPPPTPMIGQAGVRMGGPGRARAEPPATRRTPSGARLSNFHRLLPNFQFRPAQFFIERPKRGRSGLSACVHASSPPAGSRVPIQLGAGGRDRSLAAAAAAAATTSHDGSRSRLHSPIMGADNKRTAHVWRGRFFIAQHRPPGYVVSLTMLICEES